MKKVRPELITPKFEVGDVVWMKDDFNFNPANEVISIGCIQAIHIYKGKSLFSKKGPNGKYIREDYLGRTIYTISGFSLMPEESDLQPFTGEV